jgi:hypothetical protein
MLSQKLLLQSNMKYSSKMYVESQKPFFGQKTEKSEQNKVFILQNLGNGMTKSMISSKMALNTCYFPDLIFFRLKFYVLRLFSSRRKYIESKK